MSDKKMLPKETKSICPKCKKPLPAIIFDKDGKVMIKKTCNKHGDFEDVYWSDVDMYLKAEEWAFDGDGVDNPKITDAMDCPDSCGLCNLHSSHTCLALIDLTNRCNLNCKICFVNANATGYVYEPSFKQVVEMMKELKAEKPVPCSSIQFAGGEPSIHPQFFEIIKKAKELDFAQIQVATNGVELRNFDFCQRMRDYGVHTVYLQFDGFKEETYRKLRGKNLLKIKYKAIENCRNTKPTPLAVVLVPTICKTINNDEVGEIVNFAVKNFDVIRGVIFQPVSFTGRINKKKRMEQRYTLPDLVHDLKQQTDFLEKDDFYPVSSVVPISKLHSSLTGKPKIALTVHQHCGIATILFKENDHVIPITRIIDVKGILSKLVEMEKSKRLHTLVEWRNKIRKKLPIGGRGIFGYLKMPYIKIFFSRWFINTRKYQTIYNKLERFADEVFEEKGKGPLSRIFWDSLLIGGMHFQDSYNFDVERVKRCGIHYATLDGRIIPFCTYNSGPTYREKIEKNFSIPLEEWKKKNGKVFF